MSDWVGIQTRYVWELVQKTEWEERAPVLELMYIEHAMDRCYGGWGQLNRIEMNRLTELFEKYPHECERIELELQIKYMGRSAPMLLRGDSAHDDYEPMGHSGPEFASLYRFFRRCHNMRLELRREHDRDMCSEPRGQRGK